jgi:glutathione S-transferase
MLPTLVTISFSHYCEKARWALDRGKIPYREEAYVPLTHFFGTLHRGGRSTPLLHFADRAPLTDSRDIVAFVETERPGSLFPQDSAGRKEVEDLCDRFDSELGPHARRMGYHAILSSGAKLAPVIRATTTGAQRFFAPIIGAIAPHAIKRLLRVDGPGAARSQVKVESVLRDVEDKLSDGRSYLVGDHFSAADLTFASLMTPLVDVPEHPVMTKFPTPPKLTAMRAEFAERPSGRFVARLYRDHRGETVPA